MPEIGEVFYPQKVLPRLGQYVGPLYPICLMDYEGLSLYAKHCWLVLARYIGKNGGYSPSYETIAKKGSMSPRKAQGAIRELVEKGFIRKTRGGKGKTNSYQFFFHEVFASEPDPTPRIAPEPTESETPICREPDTKGFSPEDLRKYGMMGCEGKRMCINCDERPSCINYLALRPDLDGIIMGFVKEGMTISEINRKFEVDLPPNYKPLPKDNRKPGVGKGMERGPLTSKEYERLRDELIKLYRSRV